MLLALRATHHLLFGSRQMGGSNLLWAALLNILGFVIVALFEENAFRGYLLHTLADGMGFWPGAILMSLLFAGLHVQNPGESKVGIVAVFFFGMMLALSLLRTRRPFLGVWFYLLLGYFESVLFVGSPTGPCSTGASAQHASVWSSVDHGRERWP